jgi:hypothetical protein
VGTDLGVSSLLVLELEAWRGVDELRVPGVRFCAMPILEELVVARRCDVCKNSLSLGRTFSMSPTGRLSSPQRSEISVAVAVSHENGCWAAIGRPSTLSPHEAADGTASVDGPAGAVGSATSA